MSADEGARDLFVAVVSIVPTRRRRFLWAAWWTAPPRAKPFQRPDASSGGALTVEEAHQAAEAAAGQPLAVTDPRWAGAWMRVLRGQEPIPKPRSPSDASRSRVEAAPPLGSPSWARSKLGVSRSANAVEIKKAFRVVALATHPDRGGDERAFIEAQRAFEVAVANAERPRKKKR